MTPEEIREKLYEAIRIAEHLPDRERGWLRVKAAWPEYQVQFEDLIIGDETKLHDVTKRMFDRAPPRREQPSREALDNLIERLDWWLWVDERPAHQRKGLSRKQKVLRYRALNMGWTRIASKLHRSVRQCQRWEKASIDTIHRRWHLKNDAQYKNPELFRKGCA